ncbi:hypothetical protein BDK51DRAFT_30000 [Blyttiomyces helicus]|uniref:G-protein coupled receptors family 3 profile domain-containing protein n=1 Tax=Blyttiomyces helicus TaxID=388810 RepID=A0A4V1IRA2_9FUNG|nr:hypothetical protein BDK51DRAFT_30000 [Blyttiomyces helicus]|eukprot:RKO89347.1 hypothetical protein BDK51DRAFT_30000 [Blyttiomyces helicus]
MLAARDLSALGAFSAKDNVLPGVLIGYNALLLAFSCILAFQTRNVYSAFNEAKATGAVIYNIVICAIVELIMTYTTSTTQIVHFVVKSVLTLIAITVTYTLLIGRFVWRFLESTKGDSERIKSTSSLKPASKTSKPTSKGPFRSGEFPVRGTSSVTSSSQWHMFKVHLVSKPLDLLLLISSSDQTKVLGIPTGICTAKKEEAKNRLVITWSKGSVMVQVANPADLDEWVDAFEACRTGLEQQRTGATTESLNKGKPGSAHHSAGRLTDNGV